MENKELSKIKKMYGEKFMHLCRELFPTVLEKEGLLIKLLQDSFSTNSKTLYEDIVKKGLEEDFKNLIYSKIDVEKKEIEIIEKKTPYQLLEEAGYDLYECNSEEEIQSFKKYYKTGEELCTFHGNRLEKCIVFWAVKKDAENIIREDFKEPKREDAYGTSVMGIQFTRGEYSTVSIKNRYNHTVNNPDATYSNDLDRIAPGLRKSFAELLEERGMHLDSTNIDKLNIPNYVVANDGKYYKYNMEENGIYYCPGNIIISHGEVIQLEAEKQILIDYFILDKVNKFIKTFDDSIIDSFLDDFNEIESIDVRKKDEKEKEIRVISIKTKDSDTLKEIEIDKENNIIKYKNESLREVGDEFLGNNIKLTTIETPNLEKAGDKFLYYNRELSQIELPKLRETGSYFLGHNRLIRSLKLPNLEKVGDNFLKYNRELSQIELPELREAGNNFLDGGLRLDNLKLPNLEKVGDYFIENNTFLSQIELPKLKEVGDYFLHHNQGLNSLKLPDLEKVGCNFMSSNNCLKKVELPKLEEAKSNFLINNNSLENLELPNLRKAGTGFLMYNIKIKNAEFPCLKEVGDRFLINNKELSNLDLPELEETGEAFLCSNEKISNIQLPKLKKVGFQFLYGNKELSEVILPNLEEIGRDFIYYNHKIKNIELPKVKEIKNGFLYMAKGVGQKNISRLKMPKNIIEQNDHLVKIINFNQGEIIETESTNTINEIIKTEKIDIIDKKDIAELSKETAITTSELNFGQKILSKIKGLFKKKEENKRGDK